MSEVARLVMVYGTIDAAAPAVSRAQLPVEEFPYDPAHHTGFRAWTAMSLDGKRLVVLAFESLVDKAIDRWKQLRTQIKEDPNKFGLLLKGRHVSH